MSWSILGAVIEIRSFLTCAGRLLKNSPARRAGVVAAVYDRRNSVSYETATLSERRYNEFFWQPAIAMDASKCAWVYNCRTLDI